MAWPTAPSVSGFSNWFNGSKVIDGAGQPQVVFHGTKTWFSRFDVAFLGSGCGNPNGKLGFFFTEDPVAAGFFTLNAAAVSGISQAGHLGNGQFDCAVQRKFAEDPTLVIPEPWATDSHIIPVFLQVRNPVVWRSSLLQSFQQGVATMSASDFRDQVAAKGHDGVQILHDKSMHPEFWGIQWVVFDSGQIWPAFATQYD